MPENQAFVLDHWHVINACMHVCMYVCYVCLWHVQLLMTASDLFTEDLCLVVLRAFCNVADDDCSSDFNICLTHIAEKV